MSQRWRGVGNIVSDLIGQRFEPQTYRSKDERVTAQPTTLLFFHPRRALKNVALRFEERLS